MKVVLISTYELGRQPFGLASSPAWLRGTGCLFVISALESVDDAVLEKLDMGHTRADFG
jgi:hypothetical protein